jgi:hypothetical protein
VKQLLLSFGISVLTMAFCYGAGMFAVKHQESVFGVIGYVMAVFIDFPFIYIYGADPKRPPSLFISIVVYLSEAIILGLIIYYIFFARK